MSRRLPVPRRRRTAARVGAAALAVALLVPLSGCSGDDDDDKPSAGKESTSESAAPKPRAVATDARVGAVVGKLPRAGRFKAARGVTTVIDAWWQKAYVGEFPRVNFANAFPGFTTQARARALRDRNLLSNAAGNSRLTRVEAVNRRVVVDLLAVKGRTVAATARVSLVMRLLGKGLDRRHRVAGRVLLTFTKGRWHVFGYDLRREMVK